MTEQQLTNIELELNVIFEDTGYKVIKNNPVFLMSNEKDTSFELPYIVAEKIVDLHIDARNYWNNSDC